ncbi:hypothetical protein I302_104575 [Kwoniella bestiolae CBS 10118]|uniref:Uncharacterized protein n=1 Tax=Kwoniella bestiolae CBS 10118 TaxID=1296100 RepID=A0A1B9GBN1_9TREE|nr:hypothetical protein I302_03281 [Kwoniella bestiolae CBS 10118]OCF28422.1 hypothetical protein I302_03281 [Kwoniella bestiolae CBS 10118]
MSSSQIPSQGGSTASENPGEVKIATGISQVFATHPLGARPFLSRAKLMYPISRTGQSWDSKTAASDADCGLTQEQLEREVAEDSRSSSIRLGGTIIPAGIVAGVTNYFK